MKKVLIIAVALVAVSACSSKSPELKSPCVGVKGSPCGPRLNVNDWWVNKEQA
jgi:hypothetical protein